jgi:hypothetical protein
VGNVSIVAIVSPPLGYRRKMVKKSINDFWDFFLE